ncbi:MAG: 2-oxoglutarate dehydrogenase complex dihydrolipoyllysine-residue succinyltransferase [Planctomycetes bacterium]|nr:2-oxoglutarate dehydrogenase complex dihydrolipoyllysine-residue succinyltransferase [Planctomycetota bacterium]
MPVELKVPSVGESITEVLIADWKKGEGELAAKDESVVEIETDKATVEVSAPIAGRIVKVLKNKGDSATVGEVIGLMEVATADAAPAAPSSPAPANRGPDLGKAGPDAHAHAPAPAAPAAHASAPAPAASFVMPAARREMASQGLTPDQVTPTGPGGRMLKEDVLRRATETVPAPAAVVAPPKPAAAPPAAPAPRPASASVVSRAQSVGGREIEIVPMSPLRKRIAERLVEAQHTAALLTTFNEIDMSGVMALRSEHKEKFQEKYQCKLGFTSFFVKAVVEALKTIPQVNAEIRDQQIVYHNYFDIGIAVSSAKGLVVPVLRNAERMGFAEIEMAVEDFGRRARENKIKLEELEGGTFTISNGGVFGSLLSTPIINPPQSGILGLHAIQDRPVARDGQVVIRPMMYVALSYDHRIVDGREAVTFLRRVKEAIEQPARLLLEI